MRVGLFILAVAVLLFGAMMFGGSGVPFHQLEFLICILIASVLLSGAAIVDAITAKK